MKNIEDYIDDYIVDAEHRIIIIEEAMELLDSGYPLDLETELKLESINVCPIRFQTEHGRPTSGRLRADM